MVRQILHVDMDAFYAAIEVRDRPELAGKPVIVGGTPEGRGVVAAASYEARKYGVHSAMPAGRALKLCPQAIVLRPRMNDYATVSSQIRDVFEQFTPEVEPLSLDEAFLDVTGCRRLFGSGVEIGKRIKQAIRDAVDLVASVGVAPNKFLAKLASDLEKPNGFVVVDPDRIQQFLDPLPVTRLWGVGKVMAKHLDDRKIRLIGDIRRLSEATMTEWFGQSGAHLWQLSQGMDDRKVIPDRRAKSVSHETTFAEDIDDREMLRAWAITLAEQVGRRLRHSGLRGRTIQLKVRFSDFHTITRSETLSRPTDRTDDLHRTIEQMIANRLPKGRGAVRLIGVGVSGFDSGTDAQLTLFDEVEFAESSEIDRATDRIRDKFGSAAIGRASSVLRGLKHTPMPTPHDQQRPHESDE